MEKLVWKEVIDESVARERGKSPERTNWFEKYPDYFLRSKSSQD